MGVVFDEVVADVRPERGDGPSERSEAPAKKEMNVELVQAALARRTRLDARVAAH